MYKLIEKNSVFGESKTLIRISDNADIPFDKDNTDYQAYLKFLDEGGVPLPADEVTE
jgi:hypothetical protein